MERQIVKDPIFLGQASLPASPEDIPVADDLFDTLLDNAERCVGLAANMIGVKKRVIVFFEDGKAVEMFNPEIIRRDGPFEAEEGCLSLEGVRKVTRWRRIKVRWQNRAFQTRLKTYTGWTAQIIQHEIDHCNGILI